MKSLLDGGASISIGSDMPAGDVNPFPGIAAAISRRAMGQPEVLPPASEVISLEEAVRAYTMGGAARLGKEQIIGSIEVGKRADLIVVDRNPFDLSPEEIAETQVLTTMVNGKITQRPVWIPSPTHWRPSNLARPAPRTGKAARSCEGARHEDVERTTHASDGCPQGSGPYGEMTSSAIDRKEPCSQKTDSRITPPSP